MNANDPTLPLVQWLRAHIATLRDLARKNEDTVRANRAVTVDAMIEREQGAMYFRGAREVLASIVEQIDETLNPTPERQPIVTPAPAAPSAPYVPPVGVVYADTSPPPVPVREAKEGSPARGLVYFRSGDKVREFGKPDAPILLVTGADFTSGCWNADDGVPRKFVDYEVVERREAPAAEA